jgi:hypothetical protein
VTSGPHCPVHESEMTLATHWIHVDGKPFPKPVHVCPVTDCLYAHSVEGYHIIAKTEPVGNPIQDILKKTGRA